MTRTINLSNTQFRYQIVFFTHIYGYVWFGIFFLGKLAVGIFRLLQLIKYVIRNDDEHCMLNLSTSNLLNICTSRVQLQVAHVELPVELCPLCCVDSK